MIRLFLLLISLAPQAHAALGEAFFLPPHDNYKTITTEHFRVIFPGALETEGREAAGYLEQAHATLSPYYMYEPGHRVTVILTDNEDSANGATSAIGLQGLILFLTSPDPYISIGEYENWFKNLIIHEYAHYLTLEQTNGIFSFLRILFGNLIFPNHAWPSWLAEGIAVHAESTFTKKGRGYGTYFSTLTRDGLFRRRLGGEDYLSYKRLMGPVPDFAFGESYYYAGYGIMDEMTYRYGKAGPAKYAEKSSWRVPYFLDGGLKKLDPDKYVGGFRSLWESWIARQSRALKPELDWLEKNGAKDPAFLTEEGVSAKGARVSPDGTRVAYVLQSGHELSSVQVVDVATKKSRKLDNAIAGVGLAWSPDGKTLYYTKEEFSGPHKFWSDLYAVGSHGGCPKRLTKDERAKDPDFCGGKLVYSTQRGRFSEIRSFDLKSEKVETLYRSPEHHHVANPRCVPGGSTVFFSEHSNNAHFDRMRSVALTGGESRVEFGGPEKGFGALFPQPAANGDVYFTRVKDGFYDLARWSARTREISVLARSSGGYWLPSLSAGGDKLAVSYVSSTGIRASMVDMKALEPTSVSAIDKAPVARLAPETLEAAPVPKITAETKSYSVFSSLVPRVWAPYIILGDNHSQIGGAVTGWDDVDQFEYALTAYYDSVSKRPEGVIATQHRVSTFVAGLAAASHVDSIFTLANGKRGFDEERQLAATLARPIPAAFWVVVPAVIAEWSRTWRHSDTAVGTSHPEQGFGAELVFENRHEFSHSITPEKGSRGRLAGRKLYGSGLQASKALASWNQLVALPPRHSNLSLTGYLAWAPNPSRQISESAVKLGGQGELFDLNPPLRGYPIGSFYAKRAFVIQSEYRLPVAEFFRGFGNWPFFLRNLGVFGFYDGAKFQRASDSLVNAWVASAGGGLLLNTAIGYQVPLQIRLEYAHGFREQQNGQNVVSFLVGF